MDFVTQYRAARRVSTPLLVVRTFDSNSTIRTIRATIGEKIEDVALIRWDICHGCEPLTKRAGIELNEMLAGEEPDITLSLENTLRLAEKQAHSDQSTMITLFICNAHLFWRDNPQVIQGIWNLRDLYKSNANMLVLLTSPGQTVPAELSNDVLVLDEPLPTRSELGKIITDTFHFAKWTAPTGDPLERAVDALVGVPAFAAEQSTAMSLESKTQDLNLSSLWQHKRTIIAQTPGLSLFDGDDTLDNIGGLDSIKSFISCLMNGKLPPAVILFSDEIEKGYAGTGTDLSGTKTELTGGTLTWTEEKGIDGILLLGVPGVGKSAIIKAMGGTYNRPVIGFDVGAMQGSLVGQSGANFRTATKTVDAISDGKILWVATCNSVNALPPELRSRFKLGTFFFDVPTETERAAIWNIYRAKYEIPTNDPTPDCTGWTGREIRECAYKAYRFGITLKEAARYVVPVTISSKEQIQGLRLASSGKYLSASYPGLFNCRGELPAANIATVPVLRAARSLQFDEER